jgi:hypothetical protein
MKPAAMNISAIVLCLCVSSALLRASAPHPSVLTVQVGDKMLPVVRVVNTDPVVMVDGKPKRIHTNPVYLMQRAEQFSAERVKLVSIALDLTQFAIVASEEGGVGTSPLFGTTYFEAALQPKKTLKGAFAAVVIYFVAQGENGLAVKTQVIVHDLPDLPAGKETPIKFSAALAGMRRDLQYFLQVFDSSGLEILTTNMEPAWQYFELRERIQLTEAVKRYVALHAGKDQPVTPVMTARPVFPEGVTIPTNSIDALLEISSGGTVDNVRLTGEINSPAYQAIIEAMNGWLFYPQLKAGVAVPAKVRIPLQF